MTDRTPTAPLGESPEDVQPIRLTQTEALLARIIEHQDREIQVLKGAVSAVIRAIGPDAYGLRYHLEQLYPDVQDDTGLRQGNIPPFPPHWLGKMARTGRSVAQVAGSRIAAAERIERALTKGASR